MIASCTTLLFFALFSQSFSTRPDHSFSVPSEQDGLPELVGNVLYVVRTSYDTQEDRIPAILGTWAASLPTESVLILGPMSSESPKIYATTGCPDDHDWGLSCKTGHALGLAARKIGNHDWAFLIDDDLYVNTTNLESELGKRDSSKLVALGFPGCGHGFCDDHQGGFCGGAGYAISRPALNALVDKPELGEFREEYIQKARGFFRGTDQTYDDIATTCLLKQRGVAIDQLKGLYGVRLDSGDRGNSNGWRFFEYQEKLYPAYSHAIHSTEPLPLTFHYMRPEEMYMVRDEFAKPPPVSGFSLLQEGQAAMAYEEQLERYLVEQNKRSRSPSTHRRHSAP